MRMLLARARPVGAAVGVDAFAGLGVGDTDGVAEPLCADTGDEADDESRDDVEVGLAKVAGARYWSSAKTTTTTTTRASAETAIDDHARFVNAGGSTGITVHNSLSSLGWRLTDGIRGVASD